MDISYTNLLTISDTLIDTATQALKAAESIRLHVASEKEKAVRAMLGGGTASEPARSGSPGLVERYDIEWPNPWDVEARGLGGWPSELCGKILRVLSEVDFKRQGMTPTQIGKAAKVPHGAGQVSGATSNMVNKKKRHWIEQRSGLWFITDRGRRMLELMAQREAGNGGRS